jgi:hypothetical protein
MTTPANQTPISTTSPSADVTWDDHYDNPKAEIILTSKDKIGFRVDAWQLKKQRSVRCQRSLYIADSSSAFFRDLLHLPVQQYFEFAPIELEVDHDGETVRTFLDQVVIGRMVILDIPTAMVIEILTICGEFQMEEMQVALIRGMDQRLQSPQEVSGSDPWRIFKFAANRNDTELARTCIHAFQAAGISHQSIYQAPPSHFDEISGRYVAALLLAGYHDRNRDLEDDNLTSERSWYEIALSFNRIS